MKLRVFSDIHSEHYNGSYNKRLGAKNPEYEELIQKIETLFPNVSDDEILILPGDIGNVYYVNCNINENFFHFLKYLRNKWSKIIFVPGNHEYYNISDSNMIDKTDDLLRQKCKELDIIFLQKETIQIEEYTFIGCTLWSDLKYEGWNVLHYCNKKMFGYMREYRRHYLEHLKWLKLEIEKYKNANIIVITHYLPLEELNQKNYINSKGGTSGYCSDLNFMIENISNKPKYWFCGHSHEHESVNKYNIQFYLNPLGNWYNKRTTKIQDGIFDI